MVVLNRIYTQTGDDGTTALGSGERRKKYDRRVDAYGTLDEVNATIGLVRLHTAGDAVLDPVLGRIQNDLFDVEADLCLSEKGPGGARLNDTGNSFGTMWCRLWGQPSCSSWGQWRSTSFTTDWRAPWRR